MNTPTMQAASRRASFPQRSIVGNRLTRQAGFTLIEILVVIGIIAILTGILVAAFMNRQGPQSITRITLSALKGAAVEYEVQIGQPPVSMRPSSSPYTGNVRQNFLGGTYAPPNPPSGSPPDLAIIGDGVSGQTDFTEFSITRFCHQLLQYPATNTMLMSLGREVIGDSDGDFFADVVDGWGRKIVYYNPAEDFDQDAGRNQSHAQLFPTARTPYFASAGEDGQWGDHRQLVRRQNGDSLTTAEAQLADEAEDNLYSFEMGN